MILAVGPRPLTSVKTEAPAAKEKDVTSEEQAPAGIDPSVPSVARIYDYWLGGKDNFASDRAAADKLLEYVPDAREMCRENRAFLTRVVSLLAKEGVAQFFDVGSGLPTQDNTHQVAHRGEPRGAGRVRRQRPHRAGARPGSARGQRAHPGGRRRCA